MGLTYDYGVGSSTYYLDNTIFNEVIIDSKAEETGLLSLNNNLDQNNRISLSHKSKSTTSFFVHEKVTRMIFEQLYFPPEWVEENISKPNLVSKKTALELCKLLFDTYNLMPDKIKSTKEEGVFIRFDYSQGKIRNSLIVEVYNTLEIAAIVTNNDTKEVKFNYDIERLQFEKAIQHLKKIA